MPIRHPTGLRALLWAAAAVAMLSACEAEKPSIPTCDNQEVKQTVVDLLNKRQREEVANRTNVQKMLGVGAENIGTRFLSLDNPRELHGDQVIRGCIASPKTNSPTAQALEVGYTIEKNGGDGGFYVQVHHPDELRATFKIPAPVPAPSSAPAPAPVASATAPQPPSSAPDTHHPTPPEQAASEPPTESASSPK